MSRFRVVRIEETRTLYHAGFAEDGRPIWGNERQAIKHSDMTAVKALHMARRYPWARSGRIEAIKVG